MRKYLDRQITRVWVWLLTARTRRNVFANCHLKPGDEQRLIEALMRMNDVLARAVRS